MGKNKITKKVNTTSKKGERAGRKRAAWQEKFYKVTSDVLTPVSNVCCQVYMCIIPAYTSSIVSWCAILQKWICISMLYEMVFICVMFSAVLIECSQFSCQYGRTIWLPQKCTCRPIPCQHYREAKWYYCRCRRTWLCHGVWTMYNAGIPLQAREAKAVEQDVLHSSQQLPTMPQGSW